MKGIEKNLTRVKQPTEGFEHVDAEARPFRAARERGAKHFVLLSAICVQKPLLTFQLAKLKFEEELQAAGDVSYSIVRPTAFFKSLAGQVESVQKGGPYVMFGDGQLASCKPISESDLAKYMASCIRDASLAGGGSTRPFVARFAVYSLDAF